MSENNTNSIGGELTGLYQTQATTFRKTVIFSSARVDGQVVKADVHRMNYPDGSEAVRVFAAESTDDIFAGEPLCDLSVNLISYGIVPEPHSFYFPTSQAGIIPTSVIQRLTLDKKISVDTQGVHYGHDNRCVAQLVTWL